MNTYEILIARIDEWVNEKQNGGNPTGLLFKLLEEAGELSGAYVKEKPQCDEAGEVADVLICLLMYARARGIDAVAEANKKMLINIDRPGRINSFGIFVKATDL